MGDRVEVQVKGVDYYRQQIDLVAVMNTEGDRDLSNTSEANLESEDNSEEFSEEIDTEDLE